MGDLRGHQLQHAEPGLCVRGLHARLALDRLRLGRHGAAGRGGRVLGGPLGPRGRRGACGARGDIPHGALLELHDRDLGWLRGRPAREPHGAGRLHAADLCLLHALDLRAGGDDDSDGQQERARGPLPPDARRPEPHDVRPGSSKVHAAQDAQLFLPDQGPRPRTGLHDPRGAHEPLPARGAGGLRERGLGAEGVVLRPALRAAAAGLCLRPREAAGGHGPHAEGVLRRALDALHPAPRPLRALHAHPPHRLRLGRGLHPLLTRAAGRPQGRVPHLHRALVPHARELRQPGQEVPRGLGLHPLGDRAHGREARAAQGGGPEGAEQEAQGELHELRLEDAVAVLAPGRGRGLPHARHGGGPGAGAGGRPPRRAAGGGREAGADAAAAHRDARGAARQAREDPGPAGPAAPEQALAALAAARRAPRAAAGLATSRRL
mmetsp:Transcript_16076/g.49617  ORF Transcript_16076/g.49617 Transcript_16076/m.49617 type:complete len:435 (-) Transcript_16076:80-1384(-)